MKKLIGINNCVKCNCYQFHGIFVMFNRPHSLNNLHIVEVWMYRLSSKDELSGGSLVHLTWSIGTEVNFLEESERSGARKSFLEPGNGIEE